MELSLKEAANRFGLSRSAFNNAISDGRIRGRKAGGAWFVYSDDIKQALEEGRLRRRAGRPPKTQGETPQEARALDAWTERTLEKEKDDGRS